MELTKPKLIALSLKLYIKYGIKSVSMDDVAHDLSVSKKTVYNFVKDKNSLVGSCIDLLAEESDMTTFCDNSELNVIEKHIHIYKHISKLLTELNPSFEYDLKKYYPSHFNKFVKVRRKNIYDKMHADLEQGIKEGYFRADINIKKLTILNIIRIESLKETDIFEEYNTTMLNLLDELFNYHLHGIATQQGVDEYKKLTENK